MRNRRPTGAILNSKRRDPTRLLDILACPRCGGHPLRMEANGLSCAGCGGHYEVVEGVPVLRDGTATVMAPDHISNPIERQDVMGWLASLDGYSLNLGAGASDYALPTSIEVEYNIFRNTDVAADAHHLPFRDEVFDAVVSFHTFEHLYDPPSAAHELYRVLKPGGRLLLQTAFVQPLHEEPHHYYNATEYGLRRWFSQFDITRCTAAESMNPSLAMAWLSTELLHHVGLTHGWDVSEALASTTLGQWRELWADKDSRRGFIWEIVRRLPEETQRRFAGALELDATKPARGARSDA
jgi:SAM-dependent methyltransferase